MIKNVKFNKKYAEALEKEGKHIAADIARDIFESFESGALFEEGRSIMDDYDLYYFYNSYINWKVELDRELDGKIGAEYEELGQDAEGIFEDIGNVLDVEFDDDDDYGLENYSDSIKNTKNNLLNALKEDSKNDCFLIKHDIYV